MLELRRMLLILTTACLALAAGCSGQKSLSDNWSGPTVLASVTVDEESPMEAGVVFPRVIHTPHYTIYSTIQDRPDLLSRMGQLMEGAYSMYRTLAPTAPPTTYPMLCYLFNDRVQWMDFTRLHTGRDANIYLQIMRGGYTIQDWYVAYLLSDVSTYSVAAHEGWHQFVARHFRGRLPPFLEEGLACTFEDVQWDGDLPRFNLSLNPDRAMSLRRVEDQNGLIPLEDLVKLQAGQVVGQSGIRIEAFYSQSWAFARFLWEGDNCKYRPALQRLLADTAAGTNYDPTGSLRLRYLPWNPDGGRPLLEHYLGQSLSATEQDYRAFMHKVAYDEVAEQFQMQ